MLNPQHLAIFATIVQTGSISRAAIQLGCGKSVVSRQLARLETELGARLIQRSTRRLALTEIGEMVLQEAQQIDRALTNIEQLTDQYQQQVRGLLRVSCSMAGRRQMVPLLVEFTALYPQVKVDLHLEDQLVDLIAQQIDVAIRASYLQDSSLVARKLADNPRIVVASPLYLARAGAPLTPDDLTKHACLVYANGGRVFDDWTFIGADGAFKVRVNGPIQINDGGALVTAATAGAGVLLIPRQLVAEELESGELIEVLQQCTLPPASPIYAVYPARDGLALKTSTFISFLQERMGG
jgi:DNA-binding transcriptional LysR family regulator